MRVALISDIHGNAIALRTVLKRIEGEDVDQIICLGDVTAVGPQPGESIQIIRELGCPVVMGNHDRWLIERDDDLLVPKSSQDDKELFRVVRDIDAWCLDQLEPADIEFIRTFKPYLEVPLGQGPHSDAMTLLCFHGSPRSDTDIVLSDTPTLDLDQLIVGFNAKILVGGHTHIQMMRRHHHRIVVNPGSVGAPFEFTPRGEIRNPWWAEYAVISLEDGHLGIDLRRLSCDPEEITAAVEASQMPHVRWWLGARGTVS